MYNKIWRPLDSARDLFSDYSNQALRAAVLYQRTSRQTAVRLHAAFQDDWKKNRPTVRTVWITLYQLTIERQ